MSGLDEANSPRATTKELARIWTEGYAGRVFTLDTSRAGWVHAPSPLSNIDVLRGTCLTGANPKAHRSNMPPCPPLVNPTFPRTAHDIISLREAISPARLSTYLSYAHNNVRRAFDLYGWNVQAAAALYPALQVNEVALRNAVNRALVSQFGPQWPYSPGFLRTLPRHERETFEAGRRKLESKLRRPSVSTGDVVAAQTYWFWTMLLTARFDDRIWKREFAASFPSAPARIDRGIVHARAESIRLLRNRIAHYEPLLDYDLMGAYQRAASIVRWISPVNATWAALRWPPNPKLLKRP